MAMEEYKVILEFDNDIKHTFTETTNAPNYLERYLSEGILDGFYSREIHELTPDGIVKGIRRIIVYKDGKLVEGNLPPIWGGDGHYYIFSSNGLEKVLGRLSNEKELFGYVEPHLGLDHHVCEETRKLDNACRSINMEAFFELCTRTGRNEFSDDELSRYKLVDGKYELIKEEKLGFFSRLKKGFKDFFLYN